jgi:hypothetical protein
MKRRLFPTCSLLLTGAAVFAFCGFRSEAQAQDSSSSDVARPWNSWHPLARRAGVPAMISKKRCGLPA